MLIDENFRNIFVMSLAIHESAHWVISKELGYSSGEMWFKVNEKGGFDGGPRTRGHSVFNVIKPLSTIDDVEKYHIDRICILDAGALAESYLEENCSFNFELFDKLRSTSASTDCLKARDLLFTLGSIDKHIERRNELSGDIDHISCSLVVNNYKHIKRLAEYIHPKITEYDKEYIFEQEELESIYQPT